MALVHNNLLSVFAGVSKQSLDQRLPNNCEEMINIYPTVYHGLRRRNPTTLISSAILTESNQFMHTYDRGLSGETSEQYVITIDAVNGLRVLDVDAGVYRTVNYSGAALTYLQSSNHEVGFSAITIKDTTFIANRDIVPSMVGTVTLSINKSTLKFNSTGYQTSYSDIYRQDSFFGPRFSKHYYGFAPAKISTWQSLSNDLAWWRSESSLGATLAITVDGVVYNYTTQVRSDGWNTIPESINEYRINVYAMLGKLLNRNIYRVEIASNYSINILKIDGTAIVVTWALSFPSATPPIPDGYYQIPAFDMNRAFIGSYNVGSSAVIESATNSFGPTAISNLSDYDKYAFVWIKQGSPDPAFPFTYIVSLYNTSGALAGTSTFANANTVTVAAQIAAWANTITGFFGIASGTVCKIGKTDLTAFTIETSDSYGSQASGAWIGSVTSMDDVPKSFPFKDTIIKVDGIKKDDDAAYWVKYDANAWVEWRDPRMDDVVKSTEMPHKLVRNADFTFTLSAQDYDTIKVGDSVTNPLPEFIGSSIRDIFFVNGRLGFLTKNGIALSQQGEFTNFFRTTILELLDDSAISTYIDSNKSVGLEYATELGDYIVLFGDKQQFTLDASKPITPATISISNQSGYEINKNVRPISHGDSAYFVTQRGEYSALMKLDAQTLSTVSKADDISSHVPNYLDKDIVQLVGSIRNQCIFLRSRTKTDTLYVYKSHIEDRTDRQKAWGKWIFSSDISSIFAYDRYLYLFGSRYDTTVPTDTFTFASTVDYSKNIIFETYISYGAILANPSFERLDIDPYEIGATFKDNGTVTYDSDIELSEWFLAGKDSIKEIRGELLIKTIMISSSENSDFSLDIKDKERGTHRSIPSLYTIDRKPYVSGNSKNMRIMIKSNNGYGFQINSISLEGQYNSRSSRTN